MQILIAPRVLKEIDSSPRNPAREKQRPDDREWTTQNSEMPVLRKKSSPIDLQWRAKRMAQTQKFTFLQAVIVAGFVVGVFHHALLNDASSVT